MNKARKVEILYRKAKGQYTGASKSELIELRKYKVEEGESSFYVTKNNISDYITAVDNGSCKTSFMDWCYNNNRADRRRIGSSEEAMKRESKSDNIAVVFIGWLTWGLAIYWTFQETLPVGPCAILGAIISVLLYKFNRRNAFLTVFILPILIASVFGGYFA